MRSSKDNDSGSFVNGMYTSKNGISGSGLLCPKGQRAYDPEMTPAVFFMPPDRGETEDFIPLTQEVAPGVMPYYAISNYGRVMNIYSGQVMKNNERPNGYEYLCLAAEGTKPNGKPQQKKYSVHRCVMKAFCPVEGMDELEVNHINYNKKDNYINKTMPDGSIESNLEWSTKSENTSHRSSRDSFAIGKLSQEDVSTIRSMRNDLGYTYKRIEEQFPVVNETIQAVCLNKVYHDPDYKPKTNAEIAKMRANETHALTDEDVAKIKKLADRGYKYKEIKQDFYPNFSTSSISEAARGLTHNNQESQG